MATTVTSKGQVTIPKEVRDLLGITPGSNVAFDMDLLRESGEVPMMREDPHEAAATVYEGI